MKLQFSDYQVSDLDMAELLTDEETIAEYLTQSCASGDPQEFIEALNTVARARGISELSKEANIGRTSLYKTLSGSTKPRFETIAKLTSALGFDIAFIPKITNV